MILKSCEDDMYNGAQARTGEMNPSRMDAECLEQ